MSPIESAIRDRLRSFMEEPIAGDLELARPRYMSRAPDIAPRALL